jgi:hypothetical protein
MDNNNGPSASIFVEATEYTNGSVDISTTQRTFKPAPFSKAPFVGEHIGTHNWKCPLCNGAGHFYYQVFQGVGGAYNFVTCGGCNGAGNIPKPTKIIAVTEKITSQESIIDNLNMVKNEKASSYIPANPPTVLIVSPLDMDPPSPLVHVSDSADGSNLNLPAAGTVISQNEEVGAEITKEYSITIEAEGFTVTHQNTTKTVANKITSYEKVSISDYDLGKYDFKVASSTCTESKGSENQIYHCDHCGLLFLPPTNSQWRNKDCKIGNQNNPAATLGCIEAY